MPKELEGIAGLCPAGKPGTPLDQLCFFQLGKVLLGLALTNADLQGKVAHSGKTPAVLSSVPRKPAPSHLGSHRHHLGADQSFRDEDAGEQAIGIEGLADHKRGWPLTILWLTHDFLLGLSSSNVGCREPVVSGLEAIRARTAIAALEVVR